MRLRKSDIVSMMALKEWIDAAPAADLSLARLVEQTGMSEGRIKFAFQQMFGLSLHGYFLGRRMQHATELLEDDRKKLYAIARACGYRHLSTFVTAFKKYYGYTPGAYRNMQDE